MSGDCSLVVGGTRGIGYALVCELLSASECRNVIVTHRSVESPESLRKLESQHPEKLSLIRLDVTDQASLDAFESQLKSLEVTPDLMIHAAGILHEAGIEPEKSLEQCDPDALRRYFDVNSIGPLMVARAILPSQKRSNEFRFAALSAMVGSIGDNRRGGWYGYRASKAALNQFIRTLSNECRMRFPEAAIVAMHPGTTDTDLSNPFQRNIKPDKLYSPAQTARRLLTVLAGIDASHTGKFLNWDGSEIPW